MIRLSIYFPTIKDYDQLIELQTRTYTFVPIYSPREFCRLGNCSINEIKERLIETSGIKVIELDGILSESEINKAYTWIKSIATFSDLQFRVKDLGLLYFILNETNAKVEFMGETFNNSFALKTIKNFNSNRIALLTLSNEFSFEMIKNANELVHSDLEYMLFGPNLIFYSPRKLLSPLGSWSDEQGSNSSYSKGVNLIGKSEESPHKGFMLHEGRLGTLMYHPKYLNNLQEIEKLKQSGITSFKIDLRLVSPSLSIQLLKQIMEFFDNSQLTESLENFPHFSGYLRKNKSNKIFHKLKNRVFQNFEADGNKAIGKCIDVNDQKYMLLESLNQKTLKSIDEVIYLNPNGKMVKTSLLIEGKIHESFDKSIYRIRFVKGVTPMSRVYLIQA